MSSHRDLPPEIAQTIAAAGFDVYMSTDPRWQSYLYFTDGTRIGYLQRAEGGGLSLSTVHIPNRTTGTGYRITEDTDPPLALTREELEAAFAVAPCWASERDRQTIHKWNNWEAFSANRLGGSHLRLVAKGRD